MITCHRDTLSFTWPRCDAEFKKIAARYVEKWLPKVLAGDRSAAFEYLLVNRFHSLSPAKKDQARLAVRPTDTTWITKLFHEMVERFAHRHAQLDISLARVFRPASGGKINPWGGSFGGLPMRPIDASLRTVPADLASLGGVLVPMYQPEALCFEFSCFSVCAVKVGIDSGNAFNGHAWAAGLRRSPQDYIVVSDESRVEGYLAPKGKVLPFLPPKLPGARNVGRRSAENRVCSIQIEAFPLRPAVHIAEAREKYLPKKIDDILVQFLIQLGASDLRVNFGWGGEPESYDDPWDPDNWDLSQPQHIWIHLCDVLTWAKITGEPPPLEPISQEDYPDARQPWIEKYRRDLIAIDSDPELARLKTARAVAGSGDDFALPKEINQWNGAA